MPPPISTPLQNQGLCPALRTDALPCPASWGMERCWPSPKAASPGRDGLGWRERVPSACVRQCGTPATAYPDQDIPRSSLRAGHPWGREGREGRSPGQIHSISGPLAESQITCHSGPWRVLTAGSLTREPRCSRGRHSHHQTSLAGVPVSLGRIYFTYSGGPAGSDTLQGGSEGPGPTSAVAWHSVTSPREL